MLQVYSDVPNFTQIVDGGGAGTGYGHTRQCLRFIVVIAFLTQINLQTTLQ